MQKMESFLHWAKVNNQMPNMNSLITSVCAMTAKYTDPGVRKAIENGSQLIFSALFGPKALINETLFFPSEENEEKLINYLRFADKYIYIAIYTITNSKLARVLYTLWKDGVDVRIITDDETMGSQGCDIQNLANAGIPIRNDTNMQSRMHHKFMVIDDELVMNGSFNWTVSAVKNNNENVVVSSDATQIQSFKTEFLRLWDLYTKGQLKSNGQVVQDLIEYHKNQQSSGGNRQYKKVSYNAYNEYGHY